MKDTPKRGRIQVRYVPGSGSCLSSARAERVCKELGFPVYGEYWRNVRAVVLAESLVSHVRPCGDRFDVPYSPQSDLICSVRLGNTDWPACDCEAWQQHNSTLEFINDPVGDQCWVCQHGAAVLLYLGVSASFDAHLREKAGISEQFVPPQGVHRHRFNLAAAEVRRGTQVS